ncbi:XcbB/CpsF family capsular polysaccharide biosynthesis protein [Pseudomonas putida]|uniref:XcbB/CpsF family capsular polysaccharide biosynthesis protein n=1 Tax=Pseudomonas putida TaxID=303 RepID=UPI003906D147
MATKTKKVVLGGQVAEVLADLNSIDYVHVDHSAYGDCENLIHVSRKNPLAKSYVVELANAGFSLYKSNDHMSSFVRNSVIPDLWHRVKAGEFKTAHGLVYQLEVPKVHKASRMLVVFSSIGEDIFTSSLMRLFTFNFKSIGKYLPADTAVLRIADLGGVVGSFYLNNNADPEFAHRVTSLINTVGQELGVEKESITLYGASKGGTGALYHGVVGGFNAVVVDPIVSDEYYESVFRDSHFTIGTFPESKQQVFARILDSDLRLKQSISIVYSSRSPQYDYINRIVKKSRVGRQFDYLNSVNSLINDHPDVGAQTVNIAVMLMNISLYQIPTKCYCLDVV